MSAARDEVLRRIRAALHDVPATEAPAEVSVARGYHHTTNADHDVLVEQFAERVADYRARVEHVRRPDLAARIAAALARNDIERLIVPADLPDDWLPDAVTLLRDNGQHSYAELDGSDGVLTGCALGIAQTGTIVLDHGDYQGRRAISLVPDYHLCVVRADQIVGVVPEAFTKLTGAARAGRPMTFISGPSATSDIELNRVEGVHGPRTLEVLIVAE